MTVSLSQLLEESFQIAWDYLERTGELGDGATASRFLSDTIEARIRRGERSRLALSNRAISAFGRHQPGIVTKRCEFAAQVMCADAGFHSDQARRYIGKPGFHLATRPFLPQHYGAARIVAYDVERVLADIDADHGDRISVSEWTDLALPRSGHSPDCALPVRSWSDGRSQGMAETDSELIDRLARRHSVSAAAVQVVMSALRSGGGRMAQFSHADFGGMSRWSPGTSMVGDMFNPQLKSKLDALCTDIAAHLASEKIIGGVRSAVDEVSYRSMPGSSDWWPSGLGRPGAVGAPKDLRYAVFPEARRLVIDDRGSVSIFGVAQSSDQTAWTAV